MVQAIRRETLWQGLVAGFLIVVASCIGRGFIKGVLLPILTCCLVWLKQAIFQLLIIGLAAIAGLVALLLIIKRFGMLNERNDTND